MNGDTRSMRATLFAGTRPEIVKTASVLRALRAMGAHAEFVTTGQHQGSEMAGSFLRDRDVDPAEQWTLVGDEATRTASLLGQALTYFADQRRPDVAIVQGDTWTVALVALAACRHGVPVVHIEAGLRSYNPLSPEESNRRVAAALANLHFAPTERARANLEREGVDQDHVYVVGNTGCDALRTSGVDRVDLEQRGGILVTAHRSGTVDHPERLRVLVDIVRALAKECAPVIWPLHPRTADRLSAAGMSGLLEHPRISVLDPQTHQKMLRLVASSRLVVTDSGGLQEEAAWFGVPVAVLRNSTPRPEGVDVGQAVLIGLDEVRALTAATHLLIPSTQRRIDALSCPYGDGYAAERIAKILIDLHHTDSLSLHEPVISSVAKET